MIFFFFCLCCYLNLKIQYLIYRQYVRLGDWNPNTTVDCSGDICSDPQIEIPVLRTFTRLEKSLDRPWVVNIGIIKLAYSVQYTNWISPICLPYADHLYQNDHNYLGATFITTGWSLNKGSMKYDYFWFHVFFSVLSNF